MRKPCAVVVSAPGLGAAGQLGIADSKLLGQLGRMAEGGAFGLIRGVPAANVTQDLWLIATGLTLRELGGGGSDPGIPPKTATNPAGLIYSDRQPFWEISALQNSESCSIAWPGARNSNADHLLVVTDEVHTPFGSSRRNWPLLPGSVNRSEYRSQILDLRVHPSEVPESDVDHMLNGLPDLVLRNATRNLISATATIQAITLDVIAKRRHTLIALHFDILDQMRLLQGVALHHAAAVITRAHEFFDMLVGNLRSTLPSNGVLIIVSPPTWNVAGGVCPGAVIISGAGFEPNTLLEDPRPEDIAPTALYIADCALPQSWFGRPLCGAATRLQAS